MRFLTFFCVHHIVLMFCSFIIPHIPSPTALSLLLLPNFSLRDSFLNQFCIGHLSCCVHGTSHWVMSRRHFIVPHPLILGVFPPLLQCFVGLRVGGNDVPFRTKCSAVSPSIKVGLFHCSISHACFFWSFLLFSIFCICIDMVPCDILCLSITGLCYSSTFCPLLTS